MFCKFFVPGQVYAVSGKYADIIVCKLCDLISKLKYRILKIRVHINICFEEFSIFLNLTKPS